MCPNRTNDTVGSKSIRVVTTKATKKGFTVALAANGVSPAVIIFKEKGGKLGPPVSSHCSIQVMGSTNGWMTAISTILGYIPSMALTWQCDTL